MSAQLKKGVQLKFPTDQLRKRLIGGENDAGHEDEGDSFAGDREEARPDDEELKLETHECPTCPEVKIGTNYLASLKKLQIAAAVIIGIFWLTTLIIVLVKRFCSNPAALIGDTSTLFRTWGGADPQFLGTFIMDPLLLTRSNFEIVIPAVLFGFVPALIHFILAVSPTTKKTENAGEPIFLWYANYALNNRVNPLRWITYGWSYTMVAWIVLMFSGVTDVVALGVLIALKLGVYGAMWIFEVQNQRRPYVRWESFGLAAFLFAVYWIAVALHFGAQMITAPSITVTPGYFWAFVGGSALFCILGGLIVIIHFVSSYKQKNNFAYELWMTIHEILAMVFFSLVIIVATFMAPPF